MKIVVIGGVAAGTKAAAKLKREDRSAQVKVLTKSTDISYAGCGLPYYVGGLIGSRDELIVNTPQKYMGLTGAEVVTGCEVTAVDPAAKTVTAVKNGEVFTEGYDKLIIASGATPVVPDMPGEGAGVDAGKAHDAVLLQISVQRSLAAEIGGLLAPLPHDIRRKGRAPAFKIRGDHAVIPDEREGLHNDLPVIAGVGQGFQVTDHAGGKDHLAGDLPRRAERLSLKNGAVLQNQIDAFFHQYPPSIATGFTLFLLLYTIFAVQ